ncbi:MAG TPA: glycosyltransferase [Acidimicrobiales bacterium]|nr:glycosyltransferase [Acidimicrobiales bacterium]
MRKLAVLSMHTSPLAQPGTGDGGGMNVYVRELSTALARAGVSCDVYTRAWRPGLADTVNVEPGFRVHHVAAGPQDHVEKEELFGLVDEFTDAVYARITGAAAAGEGLPDAIHANYWLSGLAGHTIKHRLELPLVSTFHTLDRVKAVASPEDVDAHESSLRSGAEAAVIGCSDAVLASCTVEADQIAELYAADPWRIEIVPPGVDRAFFSPGYRPQAQRAVGLEGEGALVLFVGRIQPLKGADVAVRALGLMSKAGNADARLVIIGGPSGPRGEAEMALLHELVSELALDGRVLFVDPQPHELLSTYYRAADVCVVPSRSESFGLVALEAAACGTPVVASAVGGLTTLVDHGVTGFLVEDPVDPAVDRAEAFAARTTQILEDADLAAAMGLAAADASRRYTWPLAAARLRRLYVDLTSRSLIQCG